MFPNLFENFYLYYLVATRFFPRLVPTTPRQLAVALLVLYIRSWRRNTCCTSQNSRPWSTFKSTFLALFLAR